MSETNISSYRHTTELLQAALPYVNDSSRANMEIFIKANELMDSFSKTSKHEVSACSVSSQDIDYEGLFLSLQKVSTPKESETLNMLLNFFKTQKLYQTYQSMKDILPAGEGGHFARTQLLPLVENFFETQKNKERGISS